MRNWWFKMKADITIAAFVPLFRSGHFSMGKNSSINVVGFPITRLYHGNRPDAIEHYPVLQRHTSQEGVHMVQ